LNFFITGATGFVGSALLARVAYHPHVEGEHGGPAPAGQKPVLDPEAQHFAIGGFPELPFTLGLLLAVFGLALEVPARAPLRFGIGYGLPEPTTLPYLPTDAGICFWGKIW